MAVGAGGPLTGRGAHILILDDIIKNYEEASSKVIRDSRWHWYASTAYTRLAPGGGVLAMATRWHCDDPSGRMLAQLANGEENWRVVSYPAIAEEDEQFRRIGEALHPERYPLGQLEQIRSVLGSRMFAALYQQRPSPDGGGLFQRGWCGRRYTHDPQRPPRLYTEIACSVDATFKDAATSDFVSLQAWGRVGWTEYHLLDEVHARMDYVATRQAMRDFARKWRPSAFVVEAAANGEALLSDLKSEIPALVSFSPSKYGKKEVRAQFSTPMWEAGCVALPSLPWVGDYVEELCSFPVGTNDDRVDAMAQLFVWWQERRGRTTSADLNRAAASLLRR
jgi:predicted phage terminase large subunit-like protein